MRVSTAFTALVGVCAQLLSAAPTQSFNVNHTMIPPCRQERFPCRIIGPGPRFSIVLWYAEAADLERGNIESTCGVAAESWEVESFHVPPGGEDIGCVQAIATFKMANGSRDGPVACVGSGLTRPFAKIMCVD
ncbi:hypothetical protein MGG_08376 [Pyricularia oryzae 70-15]|uniref:Ig-like domain-containing protein n=3 Tax=Pyricularia oryzae TaxID=318829 RepID=G4MWB7_PYRO7|nr:uncharacterized protein MGG_08376 [Pyricularia oryzae 70-15]EHA55877.1 hypothetical protein MGG_08376 [Pyricularia oryzae 70-15]ELQ32832.1 hypothetical protein OOU_Y34scaffold01028g1 [Pyricularia oryzae Y34]KAI7910300.1 hypothetical protein M9X92_011192 [Pyricularia oryzae]KAI7913855.1 hypothetical protein M0657_009811 [Pyricularia oryzae]